ncbi:hypothetical protein HanRHA438_Chr15g0702861 [Helianthus annuus]|uniref:D-ribose-binding periplasmic protein n=1 Tax=Helianthus annuus TaxID=4232 RepID=A0A251S7N0_HELAN|nr:uncharacterized protein LOC110911395 [Helianthus annuus]KAF5764292.1 hypothetical protein HanXRQr2_Chr15g0690371 [Helianthus annuus]KAJ0450992.1 hypothetical protein HanHA300_Chr15g0562541 [Helianthus annuus]KAJ0455357.1 hypothetical protein HanIR_Chr15g0750281 [Helianthus annuus]KAJ0472852.1 hypothetical protein HanHA89_Chr15g0611751 [Helianthus annuus]KAJ0648457.1 hypothetical protein HanLR1_Chr15g0573151 [Helianthus annuus]
MGNCQAVDAAALVIQHPSGKIERMYWSVTAGEIMKMNPGHYVSLIIPLPGAENHDGSGNKTVRFTRVKLLRPSDTLVLGRAYRLVTSHEVMKVLRAKRQAKMNKEQSETMVEKENDGDKLESSSRVLAHDRTSRQRSGSFSKSKTWRPSLQSISEAATASR